MPLLPLRYMAKPLGFPLLEAHSSDILKHGDSLDSRPGERPARKCRKDLQLDESKAFQSLTDAPDERKLYDISK